MPQPQNPFPPVEPARRISPATYFIFLGVFALILFAGHSPYLTLPYFWDELGQFVPAALDILHDGAWVPHSAVPNVHPPGVMAWLALIWKIAGYSIPATRSAMLILAAAGVLFSFLLAIRLLEHLRGVPALLAILLLFLDPLFYAQSMMAQLDMPAMVFTLAGLLLFLDHRHFLAALVCTALVLTKETGVLLPLLCGLTLLTERGRERQAFYYLGPCLALAAWLAFLWHTTGTPLGDPGFAHYNIAYSLKPMRVATSLARRLYYLGFAGFRWIGTIAIVYAWRRGLFASRAWRFTSILFAAHVVLVSILGGAELERYLLPVLPLLYIAAAAGWTLYRDIWRNASVAVLALGLLAGLLINPPYPFPFENNLAMADFVSLHQSAAAFLEREYSQENIHTAWPLTAALRNPQFGYVQHGLKTTETSDLHRSTLARLNAADLQVLVLYSRTWEPSWGVLRIPAARAFLTRFYDYEPQMTALECRQILGLEQRMRWTRRGQWIEVYSKQTGPKSEPPKSIAYHDSLRRY